MTDSPGATPPCQVYYHTMLALSAVVEGGARARSHCHFVPPLIRFIPGLLTYSVPLFLKRQRDRTLGAPRAALLRYDLLHDWGRE